MGGCDVDEVRFTRGALMPDQFLRLSNPLPADGVLRVPFDDDPSSVTTADDLYKTLLKGSGSALTFTENLGYLKLLAGEDEKRYRFTYDQFLQKKDDLTVEFFIKGNENLPVWSLPVSFSDTSGGNQLFRIEATKDFNLRLTVLNSRYSTAPCLLTDGKWHHVAMRIHPTDTGCRIEPYFDYVAYDFMYGASKEFDSAFPFHWFSSSMLRLNCAKQGIDIDELRFTHGLLEPKEFVRLELAKPPVDGETLMYLPFEGDARTIAHADHQGQVTGAERYVDATRTRTAVKEKESRAVVREENLKYFEETGAECYVYNDYWALQNPNCDTCTIEFFIRGGANVKSWQSALCYGYWKGAGQYGFLIQVDDNKQMWFKPGVGSREVGFTVPVDLSKAKWHHVAVQVSPSQAEGCAGGSHFDIFVDYGETPVSSRDYAEAFNGLDRRMIFFNATGGAELAFDELRVTKGLLPVSKFLSFDRLGMILTVK